MQTIRLDLSAKISTQMLYLKQKDVGSKFAVAIYDNGVPVDNLSDCSFELYYSSERSEGFYQDLEGEESFSVDGNKVTVLVASVLVNYSGEGVLCLVMKGGEEQKGLWNINYDVEQIPGVYPDEEEGGADGGDGECVELPDGDEVYY